MRHYSKILVPYDGSISTEHTLRDACRIARWNNSHVLVAVPFFSQDNDKGGFKDAIIDGVRLISRQEKIEMEALFQDGRPSDTIIDVSHQKENDLIVMGKAEMNAFEKFIISSFTGRIIGHAKCDVFIIPEDAPLRWWSRILLAADGSPSSLAAVDNAVDYARQHGGAINAVGVVDLNDEFYALSPDGANTIIATLNRQLDEIVAKARSAGVPAESFLREGESAAKILEVAEETKASSIFMGSHARVGVMSLLMGSVGRKVAMNSSCPVFIIKP
ncbi:MAG: universal stress protein [Thermodesulfobacteriota bacterium]